MAASGRNDMKRRPIRQQVQRVVLLLCVAALVVTGVLWAGNLTALRNIVLRDSRGLGGAAAEESGEALMDQMQQNLYEAVQSEADIVWQKLMRYQGYVGDFAYYAHHLYQTMDAYVPMTVLPPDPENRGTYVPQLCLRDENVDRKAIDDEAAMLANMVSMWEPVMFGDLGNTITSIYLCTESGFMINYDDRSDLTDELFDYSDAFWYTFARDTENPVLTPPYMDTFGRGLIMTYSAPFYDENDRFAGVVCIDVLMEDLCSSVLEIDYGEDSYAFVVNLLGNIIISPTMSMDTEDRENVFDPSSPAYEVADTILSYETGVVATSGGIYYAYTPIGTTGWILAIHVSEDKVTAPAEGIRTSITDRTDTTVGAMDRSILQAGLLSLAVFAVLIGAVVLFTRSFSRRLTSPLLELRSDVEHISGGDLTHQATAHQNDEIGDLALAFNSMASSLDRHIHDLTAMTAEKERIGAELDIATNIQASMLPCIFPAFPERQEFDVFATMNPAKEVGGDFYDFFMVDDSHLAIVVADVSGKGVPAALFMVIGKTLIKDHTAPGEDLGAVFTEVNQILCEGNAEEMFITAFEGVLDLETGQVNFVNAGHEMPFIRRDGRYEPYKTRPGFVLAGMEGTRYKMGTMQLLPGEALFQYTDGVTEATDTRNGLYGMERLEAVLNANADQEPEALLAAVKADIDAFVGDAPQFDDITMLCLEFKKMMITPEPGELTVEATVENIPAVTAFVDERLEALDCPPKAQMQIDVAIDELFGNIAHYAYEHGTGPATVRVDVEQQPLAARITFIDHGKPYDPLAKEDPDVTLSAEERQIGGLGIFMVKKTMDDVKYEYRDGQNILTVKKRLDGDGAARPEK